jgi:hypothetical protein
MVDSDDDTSVALEMFFQSLPLERCDTAPTEEAVIVHLVRAGFDAHKLAEWKLDQHFKDSPRDMAMHIVTTLYDPARESELAGVDQFISLGFTRIVSVGLNHILDIFADMGSRMCLDVATDYIEAHFER